eukprot:TRINITY_DN14389_c0_g1_i11.p1 TRINITY_DN14389_c0_g1~~TRINITY_DN14389_c0_g1_i11.p1  ORF type:complete len:126 (-),score=4.39 TRINITY_DN14389_c0_g1_i11:695-1072(-)
MECKDIRVFPPKAKRGELQFNATCFPSRLIRTRTLKAYEAQRIWEICDKVQDLVAAEREFTGDSARSDISESESDRSKGNSLLNVVVTEVEVDGSVFHLYKGRMLLYEEAQALFYELLENYRSSM